MSNNRRGLLYLEFVDKAVAYDCLGEAFLVIGDLESAREAFVRSIRINPEKLINCSFERLEMMDSVRCNFIN